MESIPRVCLFLWISVIYHHNQGLGLTLGMWSWKIFQMFLEVCAEDLSRPPVMIRAGSDELLAWIPKITEESCRQKLEKLKRTFFCDDPAQCLKS